MDADAPPPLPDEPGEAEAAGETVAVEAALDGATPAPGGEAGETVAGEAATGGATPAPGGGEGGYLDAAADGEGDADGARGEGAPGLLLPRRSSWRSD